MQTAFLREKKACQTNKQTNKQASKQASNQTNKPKKGFEKHEHYAPVWAQ